MWYDLIMVDATYRDLVDSLERPEMYPRFKDGTRRAYRAALLTIQEESKVSFDATVSSLDFNHLRESLRSREGLAERTADSYIERLKVVIKTVTDAQAHVPSAGDASLRLFAPDRVAVNRFRLRKDFEVELPNDLTRVEAERLAAFASSSVLDDGYVSP